ncbi:phytanoyl-CoA dioxygenase family protein [Coleofasciculus sp. E2-BRE-01]|uniref:phytanoyl-CoA dioxygenase family protein n=1 Tax=Coleofasciculus sp. E2-BRE-01 TaxID=3069524 RepID=UPI003304E471
MLYNNQILETYNKDGFYIFKNVIDAQLIEEARQHVDWLIKNYPQLRPEHLHHPLMRDDAFWVRLVTDERLLDIAELILGSNIACFTAHYICKPAYYGHAVLWHQDGAYWKLEPMEAVTLWLAIDPSTPESGCLKMIPGSHQLPLQDLELNTSEPNLLFSTLNSSYIEAEKAVDVVLQPGDVSIHHPHIIHASEKNTSSNQRCGLDMGFIQTSTAISNEGLYLDPILVRGHIVEGINQYRSWPLYKAGKTIKFKGWEKWNDKASLRNDNDLFNLTSSEDPFNITMRMIERLKQGTTKK